MPTSATAFVPGHATTFFTVDRADDPTQAGSRGAGLALEAGVTVEVTPADEVTVVLDGESGSFGAVERVLGALDAPATVEAESDLPLGAGFGVSGALALGSALGAAAAYERPLSENELVTVAHGAEVQAGTGLGDVVAQARGGIPIRLEPGGPHENVMDGIPARPTVEYHVVGERDTASVIEGDVEPITTAGEQSLSDLVRDPTVDRVFRAGRQFARETDLVTPAVRSVIHDVADAGGTATMAMLGETVLALGSGLSDAGYDATETRVHAAGATVGPN